jgi:hypothetical protein
MTRITQLVLDILKPHDPPLVVFTQHLAETGPGLSVLADVVEIDDRTQTLSVTCEGRDIDLEAISTAITTMGGSLHSVDKVQVVNDASPD